MMNIFEHLINQLEQEEVLYSEPQSFQEYSGIKDKTASYISVQDIDDLKPELRKSGYMVFRLGTRPNNRTTYFALAKAKEDKGWSEYFLIDEKIFQDVAPEIFLPNVSIRQLFAFNLLSKLTENSLINLAISSGLIASALGIESSESLAAPASGKGNFTFDFQASPGALVWQHHSGQVEIDALFIGKKNNRETLFVIEAKTSIRFKSLAKHKLVYPILGLRSKVPTYIPMIPVYIRAIKSNNQGEIHFYIAICDSLDDPEIVSISDLKVVDVKHFVLLGFAENSIED